MFEMLTDRVGKSLRNLSGRGRISESNVREAMDGCGPRFRKPMATTRWWTRSAKRSSPKPSAEKSPKV